MADLKAKAGKSFLDAEAVKGGAMEDCHVVPEKEVIIDNCFII